MGTRTGDQKCRDCGAALPSEELSKEGRKNLVFWNRHALATRHTRRLVDLVEDKLPLHQTLLDCIEFSADRCAEGKVGQKTRARELVAATLSGALDYVMSSGANEKKKWGLFEIAQACALVVSGASCPESWHPDRVLSKCEAAYDLLLGAPPRLYSDNLQRDKEMLEADANIASLFESPNWPIPISQGLKLHGQVR